MEERLKNNFPTFFLHGFLGRPKDWESVTQNLNPTLNCHFLDLYAQPELCSLELKAWAESFAEIHFNQIPKLNLVGYSMGGRLAIELSKVLGSRLNKMVLISVNLGLDFNEQESRRSADLQWAKRFKFESWEKVLKDWNSQSVFQGSIDEPTRYENEFSRESLANSIVNWSVANQIFDPNLFKQIHSKVLYIFGERDLKYRQQSLKAKDLGIRIVEVKNAGHRVWLDQPIQLALEIKKFLEVI